MVTYSSRTQSALRELAAITRQYQSVAEGDRKTASSPSRHKVFVSYHAVDADRPDDAEQNAAWSQTRQLAICVIP